MEPSAADRTWADALRRRPAVLVAVALMAGIACHARLPHQPLLWITATLLFLATSWRWVRQPTAAALLLAAVFSAGAALAQFRAFYWTISDIALYTSEQQRLAQLELRIIDPPRILVGPPTAMRPIPPKQVTRAQVLRVKTWDGWRDTTGGALVQIEEPHPRLHVGQTVRVLGRLQRPAPAANPGQFDWADYYRQQRILTSITIPRASNIAIIDEGSPSLLDRLRASVRELLAAGFTPSQSIDHALLRALLVGDPDPELRDIQDQFKRTGTSHHLSISGLHVAVLGGFVFLICRLARLRPRTTATVTLAFVVLYGIVALPSPPVVRSVLLCAMFAAGLLSGRSVDAVQLLSITAIVMLIYHPLDLFTPGFQLSFGTVLGLFLLTPAFTKLMQSFRDRDLMLAPKQPGRIAAAGRWADSQMFAAIVTGIVAWLVSMPLIAWHFGQVNPWAIVGSIALALPVFAALICGLLKVVLTIAWPGAAEVWATIAAWPIALMRQMLTWLDAMPGASVPLPAPPPYLLALCYTLLLASVFLRARSGLRWTLITLAIVSYLAILALPVRQAVMQRVAAGDDLRVTLLYVGAGQCAVIEPPGGRTMVVDAGSTSLSDLWRKCLGPFLHAAGKTSLDTVLITHGDADHTSAVADVVSVYGVREVLAGAYLAPNAVGDSAAEGVLASLDDLDRPPRIVSPGDVLPLGRQTRVEILWPREGMALQDNDSGVVMKLSHAGRTILFPADIEDAAMAELLKQPASLKADVLIAAHHGSSEKLTAAFVTAVDPSAILSSNDRTLTHKQRTFETLIGDRPLYRTHHCGAITVTIGGDGSLRVEPFQQTGAAPPALTLPAIR